MERTFGRLRINKEPQWQPDIAYYMRLELFARASLAHTGYVRNRDQEFIQKDVPWSTLIAPLEELLQLIINTLKEVKMEDEFPIMLDDRNVPRQLCDDAVVGSANPSYTKQVRSPAGERLLLYVFFMALNF